MAMVAALAICRGVFATSRKLFFLCIRVISCILRYRCTLLSPTRHIVPKHSDTRQIGRYHARADVHHDVIIVVNRLRCVVPTIAVFRLLWWEGLEVLQERPREAFLFLEEGGPEGWGWRWRGKAGEFVDVDPEELMI